MSRRTQKSITKGRLVIRPMVLGLALIGVLAAITLCSAGLPRTARSREEAAWVAADLSTSDSLGNPVKLQFRIVNPNGWAEGAHPLGLNTYWYVVQLADSARTAPLIFTAMLLVKGQLAADTVYLRNPIHLKAVLRDVQRSYLASPVRTEIDDRLSTEIRAIPGVPFRLAVSCDFEAGALGSAEVQLFFAGLPAGARVMRAAPPPREMGCRLKALYR